MDLDEKIKAFTDGFSIQMSRTFTGKITEELSDRSYKLYLKHKDNYGSYNLGELSAVSLCLTASLLTIATSAYLIIHKVLEN